MAARRAHAFAGERLRDCRLHRVRGAHPAVPRPQVRQRALFCGGAQARRAVDLDHLRKREPDCGGHARRRLRRRGGHRQYPYARERAGQAARRGTLTDRGPRRGADDQGRLPRAERGPGGGGRSPLCQPAQCSGRQPAAARRADHGRARAAVLRIRHGRGERGDRGHPLGVSCAPGGLGPDRQSAAPPGFGRGRGRGLPAGDRRRPRGVAL